MNRKYELRKLKEESKPREALKASREKPKKKDNLKIISSESKRETKIEQKLRNQEIRERIKVAKETHEQVIHTQGPLTDHEAESTGNFVRGAAYEVGSLPGGIHKDRLKENLRKNPVISNYVEANVVSSALDYLGGLGDNIRVALNYGYEVQRVYTGIDGHSANIVELAAE